MQHIEVKNFGPLKDISLDIKDYMVFIGPQASGKSTLAKLIYFFWKVEDKFRIQILPTYILNKILNTRNADIDHIVLFKKDIKKLFFDIFPSYENGEFTFIYENGYQVKVSVSQGQSENLEFIKLSNDFSYELNSIDQQFESSPALINLFQDQTVAVNELLEIISSAFLARVNSTTKVNKAERVFIPAGRSIVSLLSNSISIIDSNNLDYFNESYVRFANSVRKFINTPDYSYFLSNGKKNNSLPENIFSIINELSFKILKGDFYTGDNGDGIIHYHNGLTSIIPLKHTSSGQQESAWLINTIQYLLFASTDNKYDIIIEEPEAHLFPDAQRDITKLITLLFNNISGQIRVIVTTHSPYVLATLNNSIKAFSVAQIDNKPVEVKAILPEEFWINPDDLFVGFMNKNEGEDNFNIQDIYDPELGLINHEVLDKVSDDIIKQFDELLDIQYSG